MTEGEAGCTVAVIGAGAVRWLHANVDAGIKPSTFVARARYGDYLADHLAASAAHSADSLERIHARVTAVDHVGRRVALHLDTGETLVADAAVVASGTAPGVAWAPADLQTSDRFVANPWLPGALDNLPDADVLLVGTGLTAIDGLRPITARVWKRLSAGDKQEFLRIDARTWDAHRYRMAPITAERLAVLRESGRLCQHTSEVVTAEDTGDAVRVLLSDGTVMTVGAVVNCTGPVGDATADPFLRGLLACGLARAGEVGLGLETADDGRVLGATGRRAPLWTLGALRRGSLWESTAMPEIRSQAPT
ncbi:hypothetical protein F1D05_30490 [Kribbella qitaiheensis]|uniref:FAD-dependent urate hydroxylase HpyO/Asp monooxygenase CreE-like FAD/NAD(P)-binding domain-containing protein n=1 Tax=Kribbella qitaiheensis TaxID=1544730 RepID=A0A7G6X5E2_9ACTN|nr:FAD/NAD(P)-binding protein [Kribbella qitaiheensis]QNE21457.1 hypothetical protein F1D05_30490 [Kribbella qitaiheensis]